MATYSIIPVLFHFPNIPVFFLENPWTEEPGELQSMGSQRV